MQLLGADVHVARQDVVRDDVLDEGGLVVLFLVIVLRLVEGDRSHRADHPRALVRALDKGDELGPAAAGTQGEIGPVGGGEELAGVLDLVKVKIVEPRADDRQLAAGDDEALIVDHADGSVERISHLDDDVLKNPAGHLSSSQIYGKITIPFQTICEASYRIFMVFSIESNRIFC